MKRLLSLLTAAALVLTFVPTGALATRDIPGQENTPVCGCTNKCTEGAVNSHCPVCTADPGACQGKEAAPVSQKQEEPKQNQSESGAPESPVCSCTEKCAEGTVNSDCPVCTADPGACQGKKAAPVSQNQEEAEQNQSGSGTPESPVCSCTEKCAEGTVNSGCPVCAADPSVCSGAEAAPLPVLPQVVTITDWAWVDTLPVLGPDGKLYLAQAVSETELPGIMDTLPQHITANGENIPVTWSYDPAALTFTATLPDGYVLAEGARLLTVAVVVKEANPLPATDTGLTIGGQPISSGDYWTADSSGTLSKYDGSDQPQDHYIHFDGSTLTLHNATITGGIEYIGGTLTMELAGTNQVSGDNAISLLADTGAANLTIQGAGSLAVASQNQGYGIHLLSGDGTGANLTVNACTLTIDGNPSIYFGSNGGSVSASLTVNGSALVRANAGIEANGTTAMDTISGTGIVFSQNKGTVYGDATLHGSLTLAKGETLTIPSGASLTVSDNASLTNNGTITSEGTLTNNGTVTNNGTISGSVTGNPVVTIVSNVPYMENGQSKTCDKATLVTADTKSWNNGWYVVSGNVTIDQRVAVSGDVKLILTDGCQLTASNGIGINAGGSLTITAQTKDPNTMGSLTATYGDTGAAIGGDGEQFACSIIINGGRITAERTNSNMRGGAGIGGISQTYSAEPSNGSIIINDGIVTATGSLWDPGIGIGGNNGSSVTITINGGTVIATGGPDGGAGIGTRENSTSGFAITINGGDITATGGLDGGAGIGSGFDRYANSKEGSIIITGGTVNAIGGNGGAGIGSGLGNEDSRSTVTITGGDITATGGPNGAGIGGTGCTLSGNIGYAIQASSISSDTANFNGIVYNGTTYQVYGDVTLTERLEIKAGETLNVPNGASLTIPDLSMITGDGTVSLSGLLKMEPQGPEDISAPEKIAYTDSNLTQAILDAVSISTTKEVAVAGQPITVHLISDGWTKSLKEGTAVSAGTYTVQFTKGSNTIEKSITVAQSGSTLENNVSTDKTRYTYGEAITITAKPKATGVAAFSLTPPAENQMAVYTQDGTQISEAVSPDSNGTYTIPLDSAKLGAGTHTLVVKFTGNDNLAASSLEISVVIDKADPTVSIPTGLTAAFGSTLKEVTLPSGWAWKAPDTNVGTVGEHSFLAVFTPADTANYNTLEVSLTVSVIEPDLSSAKITLGTALTYNGKEQTQTVTVTLDGKTLTEGKDYILTGNTAKDAGNYSLEAEGIGSYTGKVSTAWSIAKAELTITGVDVQNKTYDGTTTATVTGVSFKGLVNGEALAMGTDYTATADFDDASAGTLKPVTGKVTLLSSTLGRNYVLSDDSFLASADISAAASKLSFTVDRTKPVKGQYITFSVTPQIKGDNRSFLQRVLGINAPKVEFWVNGTTKLGEVTVEEGKTSTFSYDTDKGGLKLGKNTITAEFTGDGNLAGCTESVVVYLHDSTSSAPTGDESNIQTWTVVLVVSAVALIGLGASMVICRKKKK